MTTPPDGARPVDRWDRNCMESGDPLEPYEDGKFVLFDDYDALRAEVERLREALSAIRQYGSDTLSGRADGGPNDRDWQRDGVREMTRRARIALNDQGQDNG